MPRRRSVLIGAALLLFLSAPVAFADEACTEATARARLSQLDDALQKPEAMAALDAAKADFAADGDFDNEANAKVLAAAAVYFKVERHLNAGAIEDACAFLDEADGLISEVVAGK